MAHIDELIKRPYARVLTPDKDGGYVADVLELPDCFSEGNTADEAMENLEDAMRGWFEFALEQGKPIPQPFESGDYNGRILVRAPKWVHRECVRRAQWDGVSLNQWLVEAISERLGAENLLDRLVSKFGHAAPLAIVEQRQVRTEVTQTFVLAGSLNLGPTILIDEPDKDVYTAYWTQPVKKGVENG